MTDFAQLTVQLELQQAAFTKGMNDAAKKLDNISSSANKTSKDIGAMATAVQRVGAAWLAIKGVEKVAQMGAAVIKAGDDVKLLTASFTALMGSAERGGDMFARVVEVANRAGAPLADVGAAAQRLTIALTDMGASNQQIADITENFLKLGTIGGTSAADAANALRQLGQALASGRLQGDELRSILENMPLVGREIAKEFGVSVGKLKEMGSEGQLTADRIANALLKATADIDAKFALMPVTMEQGIARLENRWTLFLASFDKASKLGETVGTIFNYIADLLARWTSELERSDKEFSAIKLIADTLRITVEAIAVLVANVVFVAEALARAFAAAAAEAYAIVTLDWSKVGDAWAASEKQSADARKQLDDFTAKILKLRTETEKASRARSDLLGGGAGGGGGKSGADKAAKEAEALQKRADAIAASVNPTFAFNVAMKELNLLLEQGYISETNYALAKEKANATLHAAGDAVRAATDPLFVYNQEIEKLGRLLAAGEISLETFGLAVDKAKEKLADAQGKKKEPTWLERIEDVAQTAGQAMGEFFGDIMSGSLSAEEAFKKMAQTILSKIAEMVAAAAAAKIVSLLFGGGGGATAAGSGTVFSAPTSAAQAATSAMQGMAVASARAADTFAAAALAAPTPRLGASENIAGATSGVAASNRPELNVVVNNNAGALVSTRQADDGSLEITIDRVRRALSRDLARGGNIFADSLERSYNIGRAGVVV